MGAHFDTVLKPRLVKIIYAKNWRDGKPSSRDTSTPHAFKYIRLESYEDCLNNLEMTEDKDRQKLLGGVMKGFFHLCCRGGGPSSSCFLTACSRASDSSRPSSEAILAFVSRDGSVAG